MDISAQAPEDTASRIVPYHEQGPRTQVLPPGSQPRIPDWMLSSMLPSVCVSAELPWGDMCSGFVHGEEDFVHTFFATLWSSELSCLHVFEPFASSDSSGLKSLDPINAVNAKIFNSSASIPNIQASSQSDCKWDLDLTNGSFTFINVNDVDNPNSAQADGDIAFEEAFGQQTHFAEPCEPPAEQLSEEILTSTHGSSDASRSPIESHSATEHLMCPHPACSRWFRRHCDLNMHKKKHTKPYRCTKCPRGFVGNRDRDRHVQTHDPTHKFRCCFPDCGFEAVRKDSLTRHVGTKHVVQVKC